MIDTEEKIITREYFLGIIADFKNDEFEGHPYDLAQELVELREINEDDYEYICKKMPSELLAEILCEMPNYVQEEISDVFESDIVLDYCVTPEKVYDFRS